MALDGPSTGTLPFRRPEEGLRVWELPKGGRVVLRSPEISRSERWAIDIHDYPELPTIRTHFH
jgi:hypothetical protein